MQQYETAKKGSLIWLCALSNGPFRRRTVEHNPLTDNKDSQCTRGIVQYLEWVKAEIEAAIGPMHLCQLG